MADVVLITGCSSGIGRDLAQRLSRAGYCVVATARNLESLDGLEVSLKLVLDVTDEDSVSAAVNRTLQQFGKIDVLVNNAGYAVQGALEEVPGEQVRQMFDVNVFGVLRMIRAVVPQMRKQRSGCIINISSISGRLSTPANGVYSASKFALEGLSDALRLELEPFGVRVVVVEPGAIRTCFDETALIHSGQIISNPESPYKRLYQKSAEFAKSMRKQEPGPDVVSRVVQQALENPYPKARYLAGFALSGRLVMVLRDFIWDSVVKVMFKQGEA